jgi:hypothetical protein
MLMDRPYQLPSTDAIIVHEDPKVDYWARTDISLNRKIIIPASLTFLWIAYSVRQDLLRCAFWWILGAISWTLIEYQQHRWELHNMDSFPAKLDKKSLSRVFKSHHVHHMFANQEFRIVLSLWSHVYKLAIPLMLGSLLVNGPEFTFAYTSGVHLTLIFYDQMHLWFH